METITIQKTPTRSTKLKDLISIQRDSLSIKILYKIYSQEFLDMMLRKIWWKVLIVF